MCQPKVSCIMPTANRQNYVPLAIDYFTGQDYPVKELIVVDDGKDSVKNLIPENSTIKYSYLAPIGNIGLKRNYAIKQSTGDIIIHWDDDDWHAPDWISKVVDILLSTKSDITGIRHVHYYSALMNMFWQGDAYNRNNPKSKVWLNGATLAYLKSYWTKHPFKDLQVGEDEEFIQHQDAKVYAHDYINGFVAILHPNNTTVKAFEDLRFKKKSG